MSLAASDQVGTPADASKVIRAEAIILSLLVLGLLTLVILQISTRVMNQPLRFTEELSRYLVIALAFLGGAVCVRTRDHIAFDALAMWTSRHPKVELVRRSVVSAVTIAFLCVVVFTGLDWVKTVHEIGLTGVTVPIPIYVVGATLPLSAGLAIAYELSHVRRMWLEQAARSHGS